MAPAKKPAKAKTPAKKPAAKKPMKKAPVSKKAPAAKKPAAKVSAAKKSPAKKLTPKEAAKKSIAKKPAVKKSAAKKPAAKAPAVKKAAVSKPAAKPAVKTAAVKKPAAKVPAAKPEVKKAPAASAVKCRNLFDAFAQNLLPRDNGYIVSSFFSERTAYAIYEIVSYAGVKEIFQTDSGLQFITGGKKLYVLVEHDTYHNKPVEPIHRAEGERIPKRFDELQTIIAKNQTRIMVSKEPTETFGSFTVLKPHGNNFSVVFYQQPDVYQSIASFFTDSLNKQRKVPLHDAIKSAKLIADTIIKTMSSRGEF